MQRSSAAEGAAPAHLAWHTEPEAVGVSRETMLKGVAINDATPQLTIKDLAGTDVSGIVWPLAMTFVAGSSGDYEAVVDKAMQLTEHTGYRAEIVVAASGGRDGTWVRNFTAKERTG